MFDFYEDIDAEFTVTIGDNGYVFNFNGKERGNEESWCKQRTFVFKTDEELMEAINLMKEVV